MSSQDWLELPKDRAGDSVRCAKASILEERPSLRSSFISPKSRAPGHSERGLKLRSVSFLREGAFGSDLAVADGSKDSFYRIFLTNMIPVFVRENKTREQPVSVLHQKRTALSYFEPYFSAKTSITFSAVVLSGAVQIMLDRLWIDFGTLLSSFAVLCTVHH